MEGREEAERDRASLTAFSDGSRVNSGASGYAVAWKKGEGWVSIKTHMGFNRRPLMRNAPYWQQPWKWQQGDGLFPKKSRYSPMNKL